MKRDDETQTTYALRVVRESAWAQVEAKVKAMRMDDSAIGDEHKEGYGAGWRAAKRAVLDALGELADEPA